MFKVIKCWINLFFYNWRGGGGKSYLIKIIYYIVVKTYKYVLMNFEKLIVLLVVFIGVVVIDIDGIIINIVLVLFKNIGDVLFVMFD